MAITQLVFKLLGRIPAGGMWHPAGALSPFPSAAVGVSQRCVSSRAVANAGYLWKWTSGTLQFPDGAAFSPLNDHNCCLILLLWRLLLVFHLISVSFPLCLSCRFLSMTRMGQSRADRSRTCHSPNPRNFSSYTCQWLWATISLV